jgi:uncharacterized protein
MKKNFFPITIFLTIALVTAGLLFLPSINAETANPPLSKAVFEETAQSAETNETPRTISVTGNATVTADPNKVELTFAIESDSKNAQESQQKNAQVTQKVREALKKAGVKEKEIETTSYSLYERKEYQEQTRKYVTVGYRTTHTLKVSLEDTSKAGEVIDAAVLAGANSVTSINFTLTDEKSAELKKEALLLAAQNATQKADSIAEGMNVTIRKLLSATEQGAYNEPIIRYASDTKAMGAVSESAPTEFNAGTIRISANINATFQIQ